MVKDQDIQKLKGFREFLPGEMKARRKLFESMRKVAEKFGFREIGTPSLEPKELFMIKSGDELVQQTYSFKDKGGRQVTLIPEETPTRARMVKENKDVSKPIKWFSESKFWRYESTQKGRLREFYQFNYDIFGEKSVEADAEIIAVAVEMLKELGLEKAAEIRINDREMLEGILSTYGIEQSMVEVLNIIDDKEKMSQKEFIEELVDAGLSDEESEVVDKVTELSGNFEDVMPELEQLVPDSEESIEAFERLSELKELLDGYDVLENCIIDLSIIRGLAYYTGMVFEIFDKEGDLRALCGGGRYDDLIETLGGEETPAVGFAPGDAVIELLMKREGLWPEEEIETDVYVLNVSESVKKKSMEIARLLRDQDLIVEVDLSGRNFGNQMKYANRINTQKLVIVGERDLKKGEVTVKDMASGEEEQVDLKSLEGYFQ